MLQYRQMREGSHSDPRQTCSFLEQKFFSKTFKKSVDILTGLCYNVTTERERKVRTMNEKMDLILYMIENGYEGNLEGLTLEEVRKVAVDFFGEDPTA